MSPPTTDALGQQPRSSSCSVDVTSKDCLVTERTLTDPLSPSHSMFSFMSVQENISDRRAYGQARRYLCKSRWQPVKCPATSPPKDAAKVVPAGNHDRTSVAPEEEIISTDSVDMAAATLRDASCKQTQTAASTAPVNSSAHSGKEQLLPTTWTPATSMVAETGSYRKWWLEQDIGPSSELIYNFLVSLDGWAKCTSGEQIQCPFCFDRNMIPYSVPSLRKPYVAIMASSLCHLEQVHRATIFQLSCLMLMAFVDSSPSIGFCEKCWRCSQKRLSKRHGYNQDYMECVLDHLDDDGKVFRTDIAVERLDWLLLLKCCARDNVSRLEHRGRLYSVELFNETNRPLKARQAIQALLLWIGGINTLTIP